MTKQIPKSCDEFKANCSRWIATCVDVFEHPVLDHGPYDRRSAWLWMIAHAAWHSKTVNHKGQPLQLARGQLLIGRTFLAKTWGWSEQNVRTFVNLLVAESMVEINQSDGHLANVATICNYNDYQATTETDNQTINQSLTSVQPEGNQTLTKTTKVTIGKEVPPLPPKGGDGDEKSGESENDRVCREAYAQHAETKAGKTAKSARALRTSGELDGSSGVTLIDGKLSIVNGSAAMLAKEFPGVDLAAVCNKAAPELMRHRYPTHADAMAVLRKWAEIARERPDNRYGNKPTGLNAITPHVRNSDIRQTQELDQWVRENCL